METVAFRSDLNLLCDRHHRVKLSSVLRRTSGLFRSLHTITTDFKVALTSSAMFGLCFRDSIAVRMSLDLGNVLKESEGAKAW